ncbi:hypothetical protein GALL_461680 [mine drainage metagenome]|uniref:Uncharacterized protein n=1 Tax=mine drainage metagenome TaxID=410659 RepID=A0A1J5PN24_9ZZZZ
MLGQPGAQLAFGQHPLLQCLQRRQARAGCRKLCRCGLLRLQRLLPRVLQFGQCVVKLLALRMGGVEFICEALLLALQVGQPQGVGGDHAALFGAQAFGTLLQLLDLL